MRATMGAHGLVLTVLWLRCFCAYAAVVVLFAVMLCRCCCCHTDEVGWFGVI